MTPQDIFNKVATHLFTQGEKAVELVALSDWNGKKPKYEPACRYRMKKGDKVLTCAAGCLIPNDVYKPDMENFRIHMVKNYPGIPAFIKNNLGLIGQLQRLHDNEDNNWHSTIMMKTRLSQVANEFNLDADVLEGLSFAGR